MSRVDYFLAELRCASPLKAGLIHPVDPRLAFLARAHAHFILARLRLPPITTSERRASHLAAPREQG